MAGSPGCHARAGREGRVAGGGAMLLEVKLLGTLGALVLLVYGGQEVWPSVGRGYVLLLALVMTLVAIWVKE